MDSSPARGRAPISNSPSGRKLLDPRNGEHMVPEVGTGRGSEWPLVAAPCGRRGRDPDPEA